MKSSAQIYSTKLPSEVMPVLRANGIFVEQIIIEHNDVAFYDMNGDTVYPPPNSLYEYLIHGKYETVKWAIKLLRDAKEQ
jgi:hypothetical protein